MESLKNEIIIKKCISLQYLLSQKLFFTKNINVDTEFYNGFINKMLDALSKIDIKKWYASVEKYCKHIIIF